MSYKKGKYPWHSTAWEQKKGQNISEVLQKNRDYNSSDPCRVDLRALLVQRTMARYSLTKKQALTLILAFGSTGK